MQFEINAVLTNEGRRRKSQENIGKAYKIVAFSLGNAGHSPTDPTIPIAPNASDLVLPNTVFGPKATSGYEFLNNFCSVWDCFLDRGEGVGQFSSIALIAEIVSSPIVNDPELNTTFLFAIANFSQRTKLDLESLTFKVGIQR